MRARLEVGGKCPAVAAWVRAQVVGGGEAACPASLAHFPSRRSLPATHPLLLSVLPPLLLLLGAGDPPRLLHARGAPSLRAAAVPEPRRGLT